MALIKLNKIFKKITATNEWKRQASLAWTQLARWITSLLTVKQASEKGKGDYYCIKNIIAGCPQFMYIFMFSRKILHAFEKETFRMCN